MRIARSHRTNQAFTMIEIALAIGIIGFALIAIMGGLPRGLDVQRDNRADTIINQDANFFMEAIRGGAQGIDELPYYVENIDVFDIIDPTTTNRTTVPKIGWQYGSNVVGWLSRPKNFAQALPRPDRTEAIVRAISGAAAEKGANNEVGFRYRLTSEVISFPYYVENLSAVENTVLASNLYEIRLTFEWPVIKAGNNTIVGSGRQVYRSLMSGALEAIDPAKLKEGWLFHPRTYAAP